MGCGWEVGVSFSRDGAPKPTAGVQKQLPLGHTADPGLQPRFSEFQPLLENHTGGVDLGAAREDPFPAGNSLAGQQSGPHMTRGNWR